MPATLQKWVVPFLTVALSVGGALFTAGKVAGNAATRLDAAEKGDADHEARLRLVESAVAETRGDVKALRATLEALVSGQAKVEAALRDLAQEVHRK